MIFYYYLAITASLALTQVQIHSSNTFYLELTNAYYLVPTNASSRHWRHCSEHSPYKPSSSQYLHSRELCVWVCLLCGDKCYGEEQSRKGNGEWPEVGEGLELYTGGSKRASQRE